MPRTKTNQERPDAAAVASQPARTARPKKEAYYIFPAVGYDDDGTPQYARECEESIPITRDFDAYIKRNYPDGGDFKIEHRVGGQLPARKTYERSYNTRGIAAPDLPADDDDDPAAVYAPMRGEPGAGYITLADATHLVEQTARRTAAEVTGHVPAHTPTPAQPLGTPQDVLQFQREIIEAEDRRRALVREEVRAAIAAEQPAPVRVERASRIEPTDPLLAMATEAVRLNPDLAARAFDVLVPAADEDGTVVKLWREGMANPQQAAQLISMVVSPLKDVVGMIFKRTTAATDASAPTSGQPAQAAPQFPAPIQNALSIVAEDAMNFAPDDEREADEPHDGVLRARDAITDAAKANPEHAMILNGILALTPVEVVQIIAGQTGLPFPGYEHVRVVGFAFFGKLSVADQFIRDLKAALALAQQPQANGAASVAATNNGHGAETGATV